MLRLERRLRISSRTLSGDGNRASSTWTMLSGGNAGCCRAPEGQRAAQCPQAMHSSGRCTAGTVFSVGCTSTFCGHSRAQAPQRRHSSELIRMAFMTAKLRIYCGCKLFFLFFAANSSEFSGILHLSIQQKSMTIDGKCQKQSNIVQRTHPPPRGHFRRGDGRCRVSLVMLPSFLALGIIQTSLASALA